MAAGHDSGLRGGLRRLLLPSRDASADRSRLIPSPGDGGGRRGIAALAALRGLGCASSTQAYAPAASASAAAVVRSSADWQGRRSRKRKAKQRKRRDRRATASSAADVWCSPGIGFDPADSPVDCVVPAAAPHDAAERTHRENFGTRRGGNRELVSTFLDSPSEAEIPLFQSNLLPSGHIRRMRGYHRAHSALEEIMLLQTRMILGGRELYDQYGDLRLDVDNMTYEELLELGDRIGYVSTGLREEEILCILGKMKHSFFDSSKLRLTSQSEVKCSICQEEYEVDDEVGNLECGHSYHICCIKQWLLQKNTCPVCKTAVK